MALTKCDTGMRRASAARREVAALLAETSLADAPVFPSRRRTAMACRPCARTSKPSPHDIARAPPPAASCLAIDRRFTLPGIGTVVTGIGARGVKVSLATRR